MVEGVKRVTQNPKKLLQEAQSLHQAIKEATVESDVPYIEVSLSRARLRDVYKALLLQDLELALDQKVEQELWNNCYKNPINQLQEKQKSRTTKAEIRQEALHNLTELLEGAYGFYLRLLDEICEVCDLELPNRASERQLKMMPNLSPKNGKEIPVPRLSSSRYIAQYCLVHLGDIARYRHKNDMADSYYRKASFLVPSNGQPYNQLAILSASSSDLLQTVFFYFRAIYVKCPFEPGRINLERTLDNVLKSSKFKQSQKQVSKISVLELLRIFLKFQAACYQKNSDQELIIQLEERLVGAIEVHLSLGGLSRRQLLQMTFISIVNLYRAGMNSGGSATSLLNFVLSFLDLLIRPPVDPSRHLPSVLSILQFFDQNIDLIRDNRSQVWPHLAIMLNRTLPKNWSETWEPSPNPLPEDVDFKGWTLWKVPACIDLNKIVASESDQTDGRAERILHISRKIALSESSVLKIDFKDKGNFQSCVPLEETQKFVPQSAPKPKSPPNIGVAQNRPLPPNIQSYQQSIGMGSNGIPPRPEDLPRPPLSFPNPSVVPSFAPPPVRVHAPSQVQSQDSPYNSAPVLRAHPSMPPPFMPGLNSGPPSSGVGPNFAAPLSGMPPGVPPPNMPPPEFGVLPPNIMDILKHIPPPAIPVNPPTTGKSEQQNFSPMMPKPENRSVQLQQSPFQPARFPPAHTGPVLQTVRPTGNISSPVTSNGPSPPLQPPRPPDQPPLSVSPDLPGSVFVPGHRKRPSTPGGIPFDASWMQQGSGDNAPIGSNRPIGTRAQAPLQPPPVIQSDPRPSYNNNQSMFFTSSNFPAPKPVLDPDSYDRKIQSVSEFWDPASPRTTGAPSSRSEIWAPIRPHSPLDSIRPEFLSTLPPSDPIRPDPKRDENF